MTSPSITTIPEKKFVGNYLPMSLFEDKTSELWRNFMPRRKQITHVLSADLFCLQIYDALGFETFGPETRFQKWAAVEVFDFANIPMGMESLTLPGGLYAVFLYVGAPSAFSKTSEYIFNTWIPNSNYELDSRPHFQIMGDKYKGEDPTSQEEIYVPIRQK